MPDRELDYEREYLLESIYLLEDQYHEYEYYKKVSKQVLVGRKVKMLKHESKARNWISKAFNRH